MSKHISMYAAISLPLLSLSEEGVIIEPSPSIKPAK